MRVLSRWIVGYGLLLLACNALDAFGWPRLGLQGQTVVGGWPGGLLLMAAGLASAQQRRSLRLGGLYVSIFLPLVLAGVYAWLAAQMWRDANSGALPATVVTVLALASIGLVWVISRLRPREGIASRGYAIAIQHPRHDAAQVQPEKRTRRRSEAG
jgi:hypothetical protein